MNVIKNVWDGVKHERRGGIVGWGWRVRLDLLKIRWKWEITFQMNFHNSEMSSKLLQNILHNKNPALTKNFH